MTAASVSRRLLLQGGGALVIAVPLDLRSAAGAPAEVAAPALPPSPSELDSWIALHPDRTVTVFLGKVDVGQGADVAIAQIVAEELDVEVARVKVVMGDSALTCNQGGASASSCVRLAGAALRQAAAEARRIMVERASAKLGVAPEALRVRDGVISSPEPGGAGVDYATLLADGRFDEQIAWNGKLGNALGLSGTGAPKHPRDYKVVGRTAARSDVPAKVVGAARFVTDVRLPGMMHARMIRPPVAGAAPVEIEDASLESIPGASVFRRGDLLAVVAEREWDAVKAARVLEVRWSAPEDSFPSQDRLYDHLRDATVQKREVVVDSGEVEHALANSARVIEAWYEWPFQSHASLGGACAVADVRADRATVWTGTQKPHYAALGVAAVSGLAPEVVRAIWTPGPGSYGRNDAGDAVMDAAVLSQGLGRPVRVQYMRDEGTGWDPKAPASVHRLRAGLDDQGEVVAWDVLVKGFSRTEISPAEANPGDTLAGQLLGFPHTPGWAFATPEENYRFPNKRSAIELVAPMLARGSPLRTSHMRDPCGPQNHFASESFVDEVAADRLEDPIAFRRAHLSEPRDLEALAAVAERAGWTSGPSGARRRIRGEWASGRGVAYSDAARAGTVIAMILDADVNLRTGELRVPRIVIAHDCGLIINPGTLETVIEGAVVQGLSRAMHEEVEFSRRAVTSVDWASYPILDITEAPEQVDIVLIDRPETPSGGAGEAATRLVAPALGNAIFEAAGRRLRRAPLSRQRILAALALPA